MRVMQILVIGVALMNWSCSRQEPKSTITSTASSPSSEAKEAKGGNDAKEGPEKAGTVEMQAEMQKRLGIVVQPAAEQSLNEALALNGNVQAIDSRIGHVRSLARGRLTEVLIKVGDRVTADQVLARFDNIEAGELASQYETARAELARLKVQHAAATRQAERGRRLVDIGAVSQREVEASQAEEQALAEAMRAQQGAVEGLAARLRRFGVNEQRPNESSVTAIRAPFAGVVTRLESAPGEVIDSTTELLSIANLSAVHVQAQIYEKDLGRVYIGQPALVSVAAYPGQRFNGRVASIGSLVDPQTRTAVVRCEVANARGQLLMGMFAAVELPTRDRRMVLAVPTETIQRVEGKDIVFIRTSPTQFSVQPVEIGHQTGSLVEIRDGLKSGQQVVTKGAFQLKSAMLASELGEEEGEKK